MSDTESNLLDQKRYRDEYLPLSFAQHGLVVRRGEGGGVLTNVPHRVERVSPKGFEFGYSGTAPSDLALNAVEHLLQHLVTEGVIEGPFDYHTDKEGGIHRGRVSKTSFRLFPEFEEKFIATMSRSGGSVDYEVLKTWILNCLDSNRK
jgi:hypothetical protein